MTHTPLPPSLPPSLPPALPPSLSVYPREGTADSLAMTRALGDFAYKRKPGLGVEEQMVRKGGREGGREDVRSRSVD